MHENNRGVLLQAEARVHGIRGGGMCDIVKIRERACTLMMMHPCSLFPTNLSTTLIQGIKLIVFLWPRWSRPEFNKEVEWGPHNPASNALRRKWSHFN